MRLLLKRDIPKVGLVGDVVEVKDGFARNYLLPQGLAVEPTKANLKAIEEAKRVAEAERKARRDALVRAAERLADVEVMIHAAANPEGHLYGSVGPREIAAALRDKGHDVQAQHVQLHENIRELGTRSVPVVFADEIQAEVKVWVVQEAAAGDLEGRDDESDSSQDDGTEAPDDDESSGTERA